MDRFLDCVTRKVKVPLMIDSTDAAGDRAGARATARARRSSTRSTWRTARSASRRSSRCSGRYGARGRRRLHRRGQAAGHGGHARSASSRSPSAPTSCSPRSTACRPGPHLRPARLPVRHRRRELRRLGGRDDRGRPRHQGSASPSARRSSASPTSPSACRRPGARCSTRSSSTTAPRPGLDFAIVNTEKLERYPSIPEEERRLAEDLLYWRGADPVAAFAAHFRGRTKAAKPRQPAVRSTSGWRATSSRARRTA